jgi:Ser/Thr protein kinase RdoA (MazF antagonist)
VLISWMDGKADITPSDPDAWAAELGRALARVHATASQRLSTLPSVFDRTGPYERLAGPAAERIRSSWSRIVGAPEVLTHSDYWSGNVVWRDGELTGIVDWSGAVRGPRGFDVGWCRLDLVLLFGDPVADVFLAAYEDALGEPLPEIALWDGWALARSHDVVETWTPNYRPHGRGDLDERELRRRHSQWTTRLMECQ